MEKHTTLILLIAMSALVLLGVQSASGVVIRVNNPGFEDTKPASGGSIASANGWFISGVAGTFYPNTAAFADLAPQGNNVAYADNGSLSQIVSEGLQANAVYALIVEVGDRLNAAFASYTINLYAGGTLLASSSTPFPANGQFVTAVVNYDVQAGDPLIGQILTIELVSSGIQTEFDCVRLVRLADPILNLTQGTRFASIQAAIYAAAHGDVIEVPPGTYYEHINFYTKNVTLRSRSGDPGDTIIDGSFMDMSSGSPVLSVLKGSVLTCKNSEDDTVVEGFTVTGGSGFLYAAGDRRGGGMFNRCSPTVRNCIFFSNTATRGGAMYNEASPRLENCRFETNLASNRGGGIYNLAGHPVISQCSFEQNNGGLYGGGMMNETNSNPTLTDCVFTGNHVTADGGAVNNNTGTPTFTRCEFYDNFATRYGGGVYNVVSLPLFVDSLFEGNSSNTEGGAAMNHNASHARYTGCTFTGNASNYGGAMFNRLNSSPILLDCVFSYNTASTGGGAFFDSEGTNNPILASSQFLGNLAKGSVGGAIAHASVGTVRLNHCLLIGNTAKTYGGGFYINAGTADIQHCTFTANNAVTRGGGIFLITSGTLNIVNTIAWGNTSPTGADLQRDSGTLTAAYSNFGTAITGEGNLAVDPHFAALPNDGGDGWGDNTSTPAFDESINDDFGNLRLSAGSLCIDAGNSFFTGSVDLDGHVRAVDEPDTPDTGIGLVTFLDLGAYEFGSLPPFSGIPGDVNNDNKVDWEDIVIIAQNWLVGAD